MQATMAINQPVEDQHRTKEGSEASLKETDQLRFDSLQVEVGRKVLAIIVVNKAIGTENANSRRGGRISLHRLATKTSRLNRHVNPEHKLSEMQRREILFT